MIHNDIVIEQVETLDVAVLVSYGEQLVRLPDVAAACEA